MNSIPTNTTNTQDAIVVDATEILAPVNLLMLKTALKNAEKDSRLFALKTEDPLAAENIRSFCKAKGHNFLSQDTVDGETLYYIRKYVKPEYAKRADFLTIASAAAILTTLVITVPYATSTNPPLFATIAFALALAFVPAVIYKNTSLFTKALSKLSMSKVRTSNPL